MTQATDVFSLTEEQKEIVELPDDKRLLVTAGPGTGKTHTMTARIYRLITETGVAPAGEMLVLTFTRSAVREIRNRCREVGGSLAYVSAITFDSFASRILRRFEPGVLELPGSYDERIRQATKCLNTNEEASRWLRKYRQIFIDEIQDLVGVRSDFVKAILEKSQSPFSLFGDPAQGIYNYQIDGPDRDTGSWELYGWLSKQFTDIVHRELNTNHRSAKRIVRLAGHCRPDPRSDGSGYEEDYRRIVNEMDYYHPSVDWDKLAQSLRNVPETRTVAILCRTNGESLFLSEHLWEQGIHHVTRPSVRYRPVPPFLAEALRGFGDTVISASHLKSRLVQAGVARPEEVYDALRRMTGGTPSVIHVSRLREPVTWGLFPDELGVDRRKNITVSTIHRAKGLEFDVVYLVWNPRPGDVEHAAEEARVYYVALTRPRRDLVRVKPRRSAFPGLRYEPAIDRWVVKYGNWKLRRIQLTGDDIATEEPFGGTSSGLEIQEYLSSAVKIGDEVLLKRSGRGLVGDLFFNVVHQGVVIGKTNSHFSSVLKRAISGKWSPGNIYRLRISGIRTVAGDPALSQRIGLGRHGLWLAPEIRGLGVLGS